METQKINSQAEYNPTVSRHEVPPLVRDRLNLPPHWRTADDPDDDDRKPDR